MTSPPRTDPKPRLAPVEAAVSSARISLGRVFQAEGSTYFLLLGTTLFLVAFGLVMVLSSSSVDSYLDNETPFGGAWKQLLFATLGIPLMLVASRMPAMFWRRVAWPALIVGSRPAGHRGRDPARHRGRRQHELARHRRLPVPAVGDHQGRPRDLARQHPLDEARQARRLEADPRSRLPRRRRRDRPRAARRRPRHRHRDGVDPLRRAVLRRREAAAHRDPARGRRRAGGLRRRSRARTA